MNNTTRKVAETLFLIALAFVIGSVFATCANAQVPYVGKFGLILDSVKTKLEKDWDVAQRGVTPERGYCLEVRWAELRGNGNVDTVPIIINAIQAVADTASVTGMVFRDPCPGPYLHTHPAITCVYNNRGEPVACKRGGMDSNSCAPSTKDLVWIPTAERLFDVVQCDRSAFIFYTPFPPPDTTGVKFKSRRVTTPLLLGAAYLGGTRDLDAGGYRDGWRTRGTFPDKAVHAGASWMLTSFLVDLGLSPAKSAVVALGAGVLWEVGQGHVSYYDIGADAVGAIGAAVWRSIR